MLPNFLGIGAQRSGTTWLYECLREHPDVFVSPQKEISFFDTHYEKGLGWYEGFFDGCNGERRIGEFTPSYLSSEAAPGLMKQAVPDALLIACLRNPIDRAYSGYGLVVRGQTYSTSRMSFEEALEARPEDFIGRGLYFHQLQRYLALFPWERTLVLVYDDLLQDPLSFIQRVYTFLGVDPAFTPSLLGQRTNRGITRADSLWMKAFLRVSRAATRSPLTGGVVNALKRTRVADSLLEGVVFQRGAGAMRPETRSRSQEIFRPENQRLSELLGRDLAALWT